MRLRALSLQDPRSLARPHSKCCFSLCLSFSSLSLSPFLCSIVLSSLCPSLRCVCLSACLFFCVVVEGVASASSHAPKRPSDSTFPRSRAQSPPGARRLHAQLQSGPVTPGTMPGYFVLGGGCRVCWKTPGSSRPWETWEWPRKNIENSILNLSALKYFNS